MLSTFFDFNHGNTGKTASQREFAARALRDPRLSPEMRIR